MPFSIRSVTIIKPDNPNINNALKPIICYSVMRFEQTIPRKNAQKSHYNANNQDLIEHLELMDMKVEVLEYKDHTDYTKSKVEAITRRFQELNEYSPTCIITTDKDAVKLQEWVDEFRSIPIFSITYSFELDKNYELKRWISPRIMR